MRYVIIRRYLVSFAPEPPIRPCNPVAYASCCWLWLAVKHSSAATTRINRKRLGGTTNRSISKPKSPSQVASSSAYGHAARALGGKVIMIHESHRYRRSDERLLHNFIMYAWMHRYVIVGTPYYLGTYLGMYVPWVTKAKKEKV